MSQHIAIVANQAIITDTLDGFFKVSTMFNRDLVEFYRTLPTRKWCSEHKFWRFPLTHLEAIVKELNHRGYVVIRKDFRPIVHIREKEGEETEVQCKYDKHIYEILHAVVKNRWDPIRELFIVSNDQINELINELNDKDIEYDYIKINQADARTPLKTKQTKNN